MRSLFPDSVHGKLLNHRRCGSPEDEEQESKTKESVKKKKRSVYELTPSLVNLCCPELCNVIVVNQLLLNTQLKLDACEFYFD